MNVIKFVFIAILFSAVHAGQSQGTLVFDQQSTTGATREGGADIQSSQPVGQSFTPSLNAVGFVQLFLDNKNSAGTVVFVNLTTSSIAGQSIGQTAAVTLPVNFEGAVNFLFSNPATVSPGTTYYLQPVVQSGVADVNLSTLYQYSGGTAIINGTSDPTRNLYFREGIVTPEPSTWALLLISGSIIWLARRRKLANYKP